MHDAKDGFEVNAEYLGRRLFSKPQTKQVKPVELTEEEIDSIPLEVLHFSLV